MSTKQADLQLAELCAEYLCERGVDMSNWRRLGFAGRAGPDHSFASYAAAYWLNHVRDAGEDDVDASKFDRVWSSKGRICFIGTIQSTRATPWAFEKLKNWPREETEDVSLHLMCHAGLTQSLLRRQRQLGVQFQHVGLARQSSFADYSLLHFASLSESVEVVNILLDVPEKDLPKMLNSRTEAGETPLHLAARHGFTEIVKVLIKKGADLAAKDGEV